MSGVLVPDQLIREGYRWSVGVALLSQRMPPSLRSSARRPAQVTKVTEEPPPVLDFATEVGATIEETNMALQENDEFDMPPPYTERAPTVEPEDDEEPDDPVRARKWREKRRIKERAERIDRHGIRVHGCAKCRNREKCIIFFDEPLGPGATVKCSYCLRSNQACSRTKEALIVRSLIRENESEFLGSVGDLFRDDLDVWSKQLRLSQKQITLVRVAMGLKDVEAARTAHSVARASLLERQAIAHSTRNDAPDVREAMSQALATNHDVSTPIRPRTYDHLALTRGRAPPSTPVRRARRAGDPQGELE